MRSVAIIVIMIYNFPQCPFCDLSVPTLYAGKCVTRDAMSFLHVADNK